MNVFYLGDEEVEEGAGTSRRIGRATKTPRLLDSSDSSEGEKLIIQSYSIAFQYIPVVQKDTIDTSLLMKDKYAPSDAIVTLSL